MFIVDNPCALVRGGLVATFARAIKFACDTSHFDSKRLADLYQELADICCKRPNCG
jgi:hypothetical protein